MPLKHYVNGDKGVTINPTDESDSFICELYWLTLFKGILILTNSLSFVFDSIETEKEII